MNAEELRQKTKQENADYFAQKDEKWKKERKAFREMPLEKKAREFAFFKLVWQGVDNVPIEDWENKVFEIQKEYFATHPYNNLCNPKLFLPLFGDRKTITPLVGNVVVNAFMADCRYANMKM